MTRRLSLLTFLSIALITSTAMAGKLSSKAARSRQAAPTTLSHPDAHKTNLQLSSFSAINANGNIDLYIHGTRHHDSVTITGITNPKLAWVTNGVLYINGNENRTRVDVGVHDLRHLVVAGNTQVVGRKLRSNGLTLFDTSARDIYLYGTLNLNWLNANATGNLYAAFINSHKLIVNDAGPGTVRLGGTATLMRASVSNSARLYAQYLRAQDVMIETGQSATAAVFPLGGLQAFAYGESNIYYYHTPGSINRSSFDHANVLQLDWRS